nr:hypothetical protein [Tanacetum cinerariifolium]
AYAALAKRVEHLEYDKVAQALEITKQKRIMKKLEKGNIGRIIEEMDKDDDVALMDDKEEDKKDKEAKVVENDQVQGRQAESQAEIYRIDMDHASKVLIPAATITVAPTNVAAAPSKRRKGVLIRDLEEESTTSSIIPTETKSKEKEKGLCLVKERFSTSKPKNFSDDFMLTTLGAMFEKPDAQAQVWKNQRTIHGQAKVKSWKLPESCDLSAAKQKLMLLDNAAEARLMLLSHINVAKIKLMLSRQS